jgi:hypothetical protein
MGAILVREACPRHGAVRPLREQCPGRPGGGPSMGLPVAFGGRPRSSVPGRASASAPPLA